jgi:hypothetical protein
MKWTRGVKLTFVCLFSLADYSQALFRIDATPCQSKRRAFENLFERGGERSLDVRKSAFGIRRVQPIIRNHGKFFEVESQARVFFQKTACLKRGSKDCCEVFNGGQGCRRFAVVHQAGPAITHIDAEVSLMSDEQNTRPVMYVAVIVNVDQQVGCESLLLNPAMEDRNESFELDGCGIANEKLDPNSMKFHQSFAAAFPA